MASDPYVLLVERAAELLVQQGNDLRANLNKVLNGDPHQIARLRRPIEDPFSAVQKIIRTRKMRNQLLPTDLLSDPGWDMLLYLFEAACKNDPLTISFLPLVADVPQTTGLRWVSILEKRNLVYRDPDPDDRRRVFVKLTEEGMEIMKATVVAMSRMFFQ